MRYISPATRADPRIQGLSYFYAAGASSGVLPGMNVRAFLANGAPVDGVVIPASAVVWWAGRAWVYRRTGDGHLQPPRDTDRHAGRDGMPASSCPPACSSRRRRVVGTGAQMLLSEEFRSQIQVGGDD